MTPGALTQIAGPAPTDEEELAKLVVTRLVVPDDGIDDAEALERCVALVTTSGISERRAELHQAIASIAAQDNILDSTVIVEVQELLEALNESIRMNTNRRVARAVVNGITWAGGGFSLFVPVVGALTGPLSTLGDVVVKRLCGPPTGPPPPGSGSVELLAEAQRALGGE